MIVSERLRIAAELIEAGEGGLSRAKTDTASNNPAPWSYKGYSDWHTNRGVTYSAFKSGADKGWYAHTPENFFNMPDSVWFTIFKKSYWDVVDADQINSLALAIYAVSWVWGSGANGGKSRLKRFLEKINISTVGGIAQAINAAAKKYGELQVLEAMLEDRAAQFRAMNQPANLRGWLNRLERYRIKLTELVKKKA